MKYLQNGSTVMAQQQAPFELLSGIVKMCMNLLSHPSVQMITRAFYALRSIIQL